MLAGPKKDSTFVLVTIKTKGLKFHFLDASTGVKI